MHFEAGVHVHSYTLYTKKIWYLINNLLESRHARPAVPKSAVGHSHVIRLISIRVRIWILLMVSPQIMSSGSFNFCVFHAVLTERCNRYKWRFCSMIHYMGVIACEVNFVNLFTKLIIRCVLNVVMTFINILVLLCSYFNGILFTCSCNSRCKTCLVQLIILFLNSMKVILCIYFLLIFLAIFFPRDLQGISPRLLQISQPSLPKKKIY